VSHQRPSARHDHPGAVGFPLLELTFPAVSAQQLRVNLINRYRKDGLQELVRTLADRFLCRPSVQLFSPPIPVGDDVAHITDENGVMCEIEQASLLGACRHFRLELVADLPKLLLHSASNGAEPGNNYSEYSVNDKVGDIRRCHVQAVNGLSEKI